MTCLTGPFLILFVRPQSKSWGLKVLSETGHQTRGFRLAAPAWTMGLFLPLSVDIVYMEEVLTMARCMHGRRSAGLGFDAIFKVPNWGWEDGAGVDLLKTAALRCDVIFVASVWRDWIRP